MEKLLLNLRDDPFSWGLFGLIAFTLAVIGILLSIKKKQLLYIVETDYVIEKNKVAIDNLSIMYNNEQIENLMISKVAILNSGNVTIDSSDVPIASPLYITVRDNCRILSSSVLDQSNTSSLVNVTQNTPSSINVKFDYLDKRDGAVIQVIHTGNRKYLTYSGKLKGGRIITPPNDSDSKRIKFIKQFSYLMMNPFKKVAFVFLLIFILFLALLTFSPQIAGFTTTTSDGELQIQMNQLGWLIPVFSFITGALASVSNRSMPHVPKCLRKYFKY